MATLPATEARTVLCGKCHNVVETSFSAANGVPLASCPNCGHKMTLRPVGRPDVQNRGLGND